MKPNSLTLFLALCCLLYTNQINAQKKEKTKTIHFMTMLNCEMCEENIEEAFDSVDGIIHFGLDFDNHAVEVKFNTLLLTEEAISTLIMDAGFPIDNKPGDPDAYSELPDCCKKVEDQEGKRSLELKHDSDINEKEIKIENKKKIDQEGGDDQWD